MNWPWMSRAAHREMVDLLKTDLAEARDLYKDLRVEFAELREQYHALKSSGFREMPTGPVKQTEPDEVARAVNVASRGDKGVRASMLAQVAKDRHHGFSEFEILQRIQKGNVDDSIEAFVG